MTRLGCFPGYLSNSKKWNWLHKDYVLSLFSESKVNKLGAYRRFVSGEDEKGILGVFEKKKWPLVLGSEGFINWIKGKFYLGKLHGEVPQSKELAPEAGKIRNVVCKFYGIEGEELVRSRRGVFHVLRNVAIYLIRQLRGESLGWIGEQFQMSKCSSVSSVIGRVKGGMVKDRKLRARVEELTSKLNKSQE